MLFRKRKNDFEDINDYNIKINNMAGVYQIVASNLVLPFVTIFAKRLGATDSGVALINSLPAIVSIGAIIPGAIYVQRCADKKLVTARFFFAARLFFLLFVAAPFFPKSCSSWVFIILYGFMNLPGSIATVSWQSFIADTFAPSMRALALALRNRLSTFLGIGTTLISGWLLLVIPKSNEQRITLYQIFFFAAFLIAMMEVITFNKHRVTNINSECADAESPKKELKDFFKQLKMSRKFIIFCIGAVVFHFTWYMLWPLFSIYEIDYLHSNEVWTSAISSVNGLFAAVTYPYWGRFAQRKGNALPMALAILGMALGPLLYPVIPNMGYAVLLNVVTGAAVAGVTLILLNALFESSPEKNRTLFIAFYNTLLNIMLAIAPFVGVWLKDMVGIKPAFIISGMARVGSGIIFYITYKKVERIRS